MLITGLQYVLKCDKVKLKFYFEIQAPCLPPAIEIFIKTKLRHMSEISITAPEDIKTKIKMLAAGLHMNRSAVIRSIIDVGVRQKLIEYSKKHHERF